MTEEADRPNRLSLPMRFAAGTILVVLGVPLVLLVLAFVVFVIVVLCGGGIGGL